MLQRVQFVGRQSLAGDSSDAVAGVLAASLERRRGEVISACYERQFSPQVLAQFENPFAAEANRLQVERGFLGPLLDVLIHYARTGSPEFRSLYLAERRRYAPHRGGADHLRDYFAAILPDEETLFVSGLNGAAEQARAWLSQLHRPLVSKPEGPRLRLLTIGDCLLNEVQTFLLPRCMDAGIDLDIRYYYFSAMMGADIANDGIAGAITKDGVDVIAASYLTYQGIPLYRSLLEGADRSSLGEMRSTVSGIVAFMQSHLDQIRALTDAPILLHNASGLPLTRVRSHVPFVSPLSGGRRAAVALLNEEVAKLADVVPNCFLVDEDAIVREHGLRNCGRAILPRRIQRQADFHPARLGQYLADAYLDVIDDVLKLGKTKLLLIDFDNTLWNGVMADGPVEHYLDRQRLLKRLSEQGIVLAALSKNDPANVRWEEMALAPEDFVSLKISWNLKPQSIREIAAELSLGLDSFVLVDDNPAERELVRQDVPDVQLLDATDSRTWRSLERLFRMPNTRETDEARKRTKMYREQAQRAVALDKGSDYPALMRNLELRAKIGRAHSRDLDRVSELVQRTNQFNTTTIRYSRGQLEEIMADPGCDLFVGELADKFGSLGVVCVAVVRREQSLATIESFVMSCRAMGFGMEHCMLGHVVSQQNGHTIVGRFVPTSRNEPASYLFSSAGFTEERDGMWSLASGTSPTSAASWITVQSR